LTPDFQIALGPPKSARIALILSPVITTFEGADDAIERLKKFVLVPKIFLHDTGCREEFQKSEKNRRYESIATPLEI
jgi:hypothetical protein